MQQNPPQAPGRPLPAPPELAYDQAPGRSQPPPPEFGYNQARFQQHPVYPSRGYYPTSSGQQHFQNYPSGPPQYYPGFVGVPPFPGPFAHPPTVQEPLRASVASQAMPPHPPLPSYSYPAPQAHAYPSTTTTYPYGHSYPLQPAIPSQYFGPPYTQLPPSPQNQAQPTDPIAQHLRSDDQSAAPFSYPQPHATPQLSPQLPRRHSPPTGARDAPPQRQQRASVEVWIPYDREEALNPNRVRKRASTKVNPTSNSSSKNGTQSTPDSAQSHAPPFVPVSNARPPPVPEETTDPVVPGPSLRGGKLAPPDGLIPFTFKTYKVSGSVLALYP